MQFKKVKEVMQFEKIKKVMQLPNAKKRCAIAVGVVALLGVTCGGIAFANVSKDSGIIKKGVYIGKINVGEMNSKQAKKAIEEYVDTFNKSKYTLERPNGKMSDRYFPIYYEPTTGKVSSKEKLSYGSQSRSRSKSRTEPSSLSSARSKSKKEWLLSERIACRTIH